MFNNKKLELSLFYSLLIGAFVLFLFILWPIITPIILALLFAVVIDPVHEKLSNKIKSRAISAITITLSSVLILVLPLSFIVSKITNEVIDLYNYYLKLSNPEFLNLIIDKINYFLTSINLGYFSVSEVKFFNFLTTVLEWLQNNVTNFLSGLAGLGLGIFIFLIAVYYFLKDGHVFKDYLVNLSPMTDDKDKIIISKLKLAINSILKGRILIAIIQGFLVGLGFLMFSIPAPTIWGFVAVITALIPMLGTGIVVFPAVVYLFIIGKTAFALGLLFWGMLVVGLIDNLLGPKLLSKDVSVHPFIILVSVFGGLAFFGPLGFIFGPLTISFLLALLDIHKNQINLK